MRPMITLPLLLALAACQPQDPAGAPAPAPADAPATPATPPAPAPAALAPAFQGDLDLRGTEPFWALEIRAGGLKLSRPDHSDVTAPNPGGQMAGDKANWTTTVGGQPLVVTLSAAACSDGMSDLTYPLTAEVKLGERVLKGCASKTSEAPRETP